MAKRAKNAEAGDQPAGVVQSAEQKLEDFAEDLGRLLGNARVKAEGWLDQRKAIAAHLTGLRDTANQLLAQLGVGTGTSSSSSSRRPGRPRKPAADDGTSSVAVSRRRKKRTMSAEARAKISAAQRLRWARQKRAAAKG